MEGYDVVALGDDKAGHVAGTENGYLIVESGLLRKTRYAVPLDMARTEDEEEVVRLTVSKQMIEEGPNVDDGDWQAIEDYYGRSAELEGQAGADLPTADQTRAELRDSLSQTPGVPSGPAVGSAGIHQDRWETKE
jgi:beta-galactosidase GanA